MKPAHLGGGWTFWRRPVLAAAVLAIAGAAVPLLVPVSSFIPQIVRIASESLGQPVRMAELRLHLFPTPRVIAKGLEVGAAREVVVEELEIVPDLLSFLSGPRTVRLVRADGVAVKEGALAFAAGVPKADPAAGSGPVQVRRLQLRNVNVQYPPYKIAPLDVDVELAEALVPRRVRVESSELSLTIALAQEAPKVARYEFEGRFLGGSLQGSARLDTTKLWALAGKVALAGVEMLPAQVLLGKPARFSGQLRTEASFSARARTPERLADALSIDAPFQISGGTYHGYDLSKVGGLSGKLEKGGETRFDELRGKVQVRGRHVKVAELCAKSPSLAAGGNIEIAPDQQLSGKLDVSVARTGGFVGIPVNLKGTTSDPWFMPSKGYLIGAAIGTVILPVIGTTIGSSLGSRVEGGATDCK
jgi:uncharacterized protein involved in outer membrane biogenesis